MRYSVVAVGFLLLACKQPKQPLQPSYFHAERPANAPASCQETIDCYAQCRPLVEECLIQCDQRSSGQDVERARAVSYCGARNNCSADRACEQQHCVEELEACTAPRFVPPPT